jgi:hypothetical protein
MVRLNRRTFSTVQHNHARRQKFKEWIYNVLINATGCGMSRSRRILRSDEQKVKDTFNILVSIMPELALSTHPNPPRAVFALQPVTQQAEIVLPSLLQASEADSVRKSRRCTTMVPRRRRAICKFICARTRPFSTTTKVHRRGFARLSSKTDAHHCCGDEYGYDGKPDGEACDGSGWDSCARRWRVLACCACLKDFGCKWWVSRCCSSCCGKSVI